MVAYPPTAPGAVAKYSLLGVTVLGTMANNIVNVPLSTIAAEFNAPVSTAVLTVSAFALMLAVAMPLTGWAGDRIGRRRMLVAALFLMLAGQVAAALAPTLGLLIAARAVQGLACSAVPPMVMGMLVTFYPDQRLRMMGAWAAANGTGQALGPPVGGLLSDLAGWRSVFVLVAVLTVIVLLGIARSVPPLPGQRTPLHVPGALMLSAGVGMVLAAMASLSLATVSPALAGLAAAVGTALIAAFVAVSVGNPTAMVPPHLIVEARFLRSSVAAFAQMFMLGTVLVVMPLYLTREAGLSPWQAGLLFFQLPLVMVVMAPLVGRLGDTLRPRRVLRTGLLVIMLGGVGTGTLIREAEGPVPLVVVSALLLVLGVGMAMVQTPAAAGATRSPAGNRGAALGLFNMLRFSGSTAGAAWVALVYRDADMLLLFLGAGVVAAIGLAVSFYGADPSDAAEPALAP